MIGFLPVQPCTSNDCILTCIADLLLIHTARYVVITSITMISIIHLLVMIIFCLNSQAVSLALVTCSIVCCFVLFYHVFYVSCEVCPPGAGCMRVY